MKRKIFVVCLAFLALSAHAAPTLFGFLNKEIRYIDQEDVHHRSTLSVLDENIDYASRLGVKGMHEVDDLKINYIFEMGIGSSALGIRLANAYIGNDQYGRLMIGQDYTATSLQGLLLDPLVDTGVSLLGYTSAANIANASGGALGYLYRGRYNLLGYKSPVIAGFRVMATRDQMQTGGTVDRTRGHATNNNSTLPIYNDVLVNYDNKFGGIGLNVSLGYMLAEGENKTFDDAYTVGAKVSVNNMMAFTVYYGMKSFETMASGMTVKKENEYNYLMGTAAYMHGVHTLAVTYGAYGDEIYYSDTKAAKTDRNQIALGYKYALGKNALFNVTASKYTVEYEKEGVTGNAKKLLENEATTFGTGVRVFF
jgi:hypothetical protein